jgi:ribosome-associated toxin RatA of RatAB toxin-antitoxin module
VIRISKTALVSYSAHEMFVLVNDITKYPEFLPWCKTVTIHSQTETSITATIEMGGIGLKKSFTTVNVIIPDERIEIGLQKGPFSHLQGYWTFLKLGDVGCIISLNMEFKIYNPLL